MILRLGIKPCLWKIRIRGSMQHLFGYLNMLPNRHLIEFTEAETFAESDLQDWNYSKRLEILI